MSQKFTEFVHHRVLHFFDALFNIFIFLPYYFSVTNLLKTFFAPWKNLSAHKTTRGFSFEELFNRISFNLISRLIGSAMRLSIILTYIVIQILFILFIPFVITLFIGYLPILFIITLVTPSEEKQKSHLKQVFLDRHLLQEEHRSIVSDWFERYYAETQRRSQWWTLRNLFSTPPIGRDWAMGYTPILDEYAEDITDPLYQMRIKGHIIGRQKETQMIEQVLSKSEEANVVLVGEEGIGKHTIIHAFARKIYEGKTNALLAYKRILKLNMEKILTQFLDQKQRESFLENLLEEAMAARNIILLIENIDKYVSDSSSGQGRVDLSISIEKYAKTSALQIMGITTPFLYEKFVFPNAKINRIFTKVGVNEISEAEALAILMDYTDEYEKRYHLFIPYETLVAVVEKSDFFITDIPFPEKALQLLDSACVYTTQTLKQSTVTPTTVDVILTQKTHVPTSLSSDMKEKLLKLEELLKQRIIHQEEAITELSSALRRSFLLLGKRKKPLASFLFLGPTGVGKTETAKAIAATFFGSEKNLIRFDMSLYQNKDSIHTLIGSIETQHPGLLTNTIHEHPYGVLLLDEIEKADKDLLNIFLTLLDEGYFTDGFGKRVDGKNLVIIATSNAAASYLFNKLNNGEAETTEVTTTNSFINYLVEQRIFSPEFLNRFDGVVAFSPLIQDSIVLVARKMLDTVVNQIFSLHKVKVVVSDQTLEDLATRGYDPAFGARNMDRLLRQEIEDKIAKLILEGKAKEGDTINL